ncbi:uncharacterized protein BXZ73DRAFT_73578 [Epithele typhae]|uniref:uncharacterized protein n=1 Tax=Epithele typhae TaxID=378194 RepID=UPI0020073029|nr:uncharacterized protein BXZ73DRAFT_73578 [Epithele typhae]KAH9945432.1 hypothetical protein BXZ73DRAFT_73578 [Epithele typhae]
MQFTSILALAGVAFSAVLGAVAAPWVTWYVANCAAIDGDGRLTTVLLQHATTVWVPTATAVTTQTYVATRVEEVWDTVPPYVYTTTFPTTFVGVKTMTEYAPVVTEMPDSMPMPRMIEQS